MIEIVSLALKKHCELPLEGTRCQGIEFTGSSPSVTAGWTHGLQSYNHR